METEELRKMLAQATTPQKRLEAVRRAVREGMPLRRIEALLDWLDNAVSTEALSAEVIPISQLFQQSGREESSTSDSHSQHDPPTGCSRQTE